MKAFDLNRWNMDNAGTQTLMDSVAEGLVHFTDSSSHTFSEIHDDDGLTAVEIARTAYLCMVV